MSGNRDSPWKRTAALFVGHFVNDGYGDYLGPLLPLLMGRLGLSLTLAGLLGTTRLIVNAASQPFLGAVVDRSDRPVLVSLGPVLTLSAMSLIGLARSYEQLLVLMVLAGGGTALFHPAAAALVGRGSGRDRGLRMAFFSSGGTLGAAVTPLVVIPFVEALGFARMPWLMVPGVLVTVFLVALPLASVPRRVATSTESFARPEPVAPRPARRFVPLWLAIVLRFLTVTGFATFLAVLVTQRGRSALEGGAAITVFLVAGVAGEFLGGTLSDRVGRRAILFGTSVLSTPPLLLLLHGPSALLWPALLASGLFLCASTPVGVVAAQESLPGRRGLVSGLVMGAAWGVGGIALTPIGRLADLYGLVPVMTGVAFLPLLSATLLLFWHEPPGIRVGDVAAIGQASRAHAGTEKRNGGR
jgi:FSR family fosmidomycin resistance protein-like MFS transporter